MGGQMDVEKFRDKGIVEGSQKYETRQGSMFNPTRRFDDREEGDRVDSEGNPLPGQIGPEFFESMNDFSVIDYLRSKNILRDPDDSEPTTNQAAKTRREKRDTARLLQMNSSDDVDPNVPSISEPKEIIDSRGRPTGKFAAEEYGPFLPDNFGIKSRAQIKKEKEEQKQKEKKEEEKNKIEAAFNKKSGDSNTETDGSKTTPNSKNFEVNENLMGNLLRQKILGEVNREDEDLDRFRRAAGYLDIFAKGADVFTGASGREQAREDLSSAVKTASTMEDQDRKARTADIGLLNIGAQLELEERKIANTLATQVAKIAADRYKLDFNTAAKYMDTVLENRPELYTQLGNPATREKATKDLDKILDQLLSQTKITAGTGVKIAAEKSGGEEVGIVDNIKGFLFPNVQGNMAAGKGGG